MIALAPCSAAFSSAVPALRLQRVVARLRERATDKDIAEGVARKAEADRGGRARKGAPDPQADAVRLERALRLAAGGVADCDARAISLLLNLVDRLRPSCDPGHFNDSLMLGDLALWAVDRPLRVRPKMAPQGLENIRSAPGNEARWVRRFASPLPAVFDPRWTPSRPKTAPQVFGKARFAPGNGAPSGLSDDWAPPIQHCHAAHAGSRRRSRLNLQHPSSLAGPPSRA